MAPSYGHSDRGINLANYRLLAQAQAKKAGEKGYRSTYEWAQETKDQLGLGTAEQKLSSTLRQTSNILQAASAEQTATDTMTVEEALKAKIAQTTSLKVALESTLREVINEIENCVLLRSQLEERLGRTHEKLELNSSRMSAREHRPIREKTMDDVEKTLLKQQGLIGTFVEKVKRAISHLDKEVTHLEAVRNKLEADLRDKMEAIEVDSAVLSIPADGSGHDTLSMRKKHDCLSKTPHSWVRGTEENINLARHWLTDSQRLRKAIRHATFNSRQAEHEMARNLNANMMAKLNITHFMKEDLEKQLQRVRDEEARARAQRHSLAAALEAKRGPLQQAKERLQARKARPCREQVGDDVEAALVREIAQLNAVTSQLAEKLGSMDKELASLELTSAMLEDNIRDKDAAISLDERMVLLDGRINVTTAPPSSVASHPSNAMSTARTMTLKKIVELEQELDLARREREGLEAGIAAIKAGSLRPDSPSGPLSPGYARRG